VDRAGSFYLKVFPYNADVQPMGAQSDYTVFKVDDRPAAGMYAFPPEMAKVPPHWLAYFVVEDIEETKTKANELGAEQACPVTELEGVGKILVFRDPQGANFAVLQPQMGE